MASREPEHSSGPRYGAREPEPPRPQSDRLYAGQLIEHGPAKHEFHPNGHPSYYVKLKTDRGVQTLWGRGLQRAFAESKSKPRLDDIIGVRENNYDAVSIVSRRRVEGVVVAERKFDSPRPRWVVEKLEEFDRRRFAAEALLDPTISRRDAVMRHGELHGFFNVLDAASKVAQRRIREPERQQLFLKLMRETLALAFERGEPPPDSSPRAQAPAPRHPPGIGRTPE